MTKIYSGMPHLNGNVIAAVDLETTGTRAGYHEVIQIAVVPLDSDFKPLADARPFYTNVAPLYPERADPQSTRVHKLDLDYLVKHALSPDKVKDLLVEWWNALELPFDRTLVPLAHNWAFESSFLKAWLGQNLSDQLFHSHARDAMTTGLFMNDRAFRMGEQAPFPRLSLTDLSKRFKVVNKHPHDALHDCLAEAEVYRALLQMDQF